MKPTTEPKAEFLRAVKEMTADWKADK
jgi:hypothetical protein